MTNTPIDEIFLDWLSANQKHAWMVIPVLAFLEACPGLGLLASGIILLSVSTILYTEQIVSIYQIMPLAFAGACLSDHLGFYLGRWFGPKFHHTAFAKKQTVRLQKGEAFIIKYGATAIIVGRLMTAVRSLVPMMVGISGTDRVRFTLIDVLACAIWSAGLGLLVVGLDSVIPR
jgi:membrane-associated protein